MEKKQKEVTIHDLDPLALTLLVDFSYTGEIVISEDNVQVRNLSNQTFFSIDVNSVPFIAVFGNFIVYR